MVYSLIVAADGSFATFTPLPQAVQAVEEMSVDGGKVRLRTPQGEPSVK
jgi:hypothetical protein